MVVINRAGGGYAERPENIVLVDLSTVLGALLGPPPTRWFPIYEYIDVTKQLTGELVVVTGRDDMPAGRKAMLFSPTAGTLPLTVVEAGKWAVDPQGGRLEISYRMPTDAEDKAVAPDGAWYAQLS